MADGNETQADRAMRRLSRLADPLFPLTSRAVRRCVAAAESLGLVCVPQPFSVKVEFPFARTTQNLRWQVPKSAGPVCIIHVDLPEDHPNALIIPKVGEESFVDGQVRQCDAFEYPRRYNGTLMESPIPVPAQYQVNFEMTDSSAYAEGQGATFYTLGVRARLSRVRNVCDAPVDVAAEWLKRVQRDGVWWGTTITTTQNLMPGTTQGAISHTAIVETMVLAEKRASIEGEVNASNVQVRINPLTVTPLQGPIFGRRFDGDRALIHAGLRWPIPGGSTVEVETVYPTGNPLVPVRFTMLGRRGGIVGGCFTPDVIIPEG